MIVLPLRRPKFFCTRRDAIFFLSVSLLLALFAGCGKNDGIQVGAKTFTENSILGNMLRSVARRADVKTNSLKEFMGSALVFGALESGEIDAYVDYVGTIAEEILVRENVHTPKEVRSALAKRGIRMSQSLGFANTYAMAMKEEVAKTHKIRTISDLKRHPEFAIAFSSEFMSRADGWPKLRRRYRLPQKDVKGMEHALAYDALNNGAAQVIDVYSTDAKIRTYKLRVLRDDLNCFPSYDAVILYRADLSERASQGVESFLALEGSISEQAMIEMNTRVETDRVTMNHTAEDFLNGETTPAKPESFIDKLKRIADRTWEHLFLVVVSLTAAIFVAVPLGVVAAKSPPWVGQTVLAVVGILQTIPSLALLALLMVPLGYFQQVFPRLGIHSTGAMPAIIALFLYSLLPIVRNTATGLQNIPRFIKEAAEALGLEPKARLWLVELPLASPTILAGVKTAAVLNIGFATLGAFIGAGGYGQPIISGLTRKDYGLILEGAIAAAAMAIAAQLLFEIAERVLTPKGLRLKSEG